MDRKISGNFDTSDEEDEKLRWKGKSSTQARKLAEEMSIREVGNLDAVEDYIAQATDIIKWESLEAVLKQNGWVADGTFHYHNEDSGAVLYTAHRYVYWKLRKKKKYLLSHINADGRMVHGSGPVRVAYNWPELLKHTDEDINLVEGEKGVEFLKRFDLLATCIQGQNWSDECAEPFAGRNVNIVMDNDDAGRKNTEKAIEWLIKSGAATIRVPLLPDLGRRKGLDDWLEDHTVDEYREIVGRTNLEPVKSNPVVIDPSSWEGQPVPARTWIIEPLIQAETVALLYGDGGLGKSILALMIAAARALHQKFLGLPTAPGRTIVLSAEDDADEMHRRLDAIARHHGVSLGDLGDIRLIDLVGQDAVIGELTRNGRIVATELYKFVVAQIALFRPQLVIVDALADSFSGDENNRTQARQFITLLRGAGKGYGCSFLAVAHPSLSGLSSGRGTSGSTGWGNSVRSRMYFEAIEVDGKEPDPSLKVLRQPKANYSASGLEIAVRYLAGVYVQVDGEGSSQLSNIEKEALHDGIFMSILRRLTEQERYASDKVSSTYAPALFVQEREATEKRLTKNQLKAAMIRLFDKKAIEVKVHGPGSRQTRRIVEVDEL